MHGVGPERFKDFFWSDELFDLANTDIRGKPTTVVYYLHGGLHLYRTRHGRTLKRRAKPDANLLDLFAEPADGATPLLVSEGSAKQKLESIYQSDYLAFAYSQLTEHKGPLCLFGHSLSDSDSHIVDAIHASGISSVAVSIRPSNRTGVRKKQAEVVSKLDVSEIRFFDSTTHPLGMDDLSIDP